MNKEDDRIVARSSWWRAVFLFAPLPVVLVLPLLGVPVSIVSLAVSAGLGPRVWPGTTRHRAVGVGVAAFAAFWTPVALAWTPVVRALPAEVSEPVAERAGFLMFPLCAPDHTIGFLLPSLVGLGLYGLGCWLSVLRRRAVLWPVAAAIAFPATAGMWALLVSQGHGMIC